MLPAVVGVYPDFEVAILAQNSTHLLDFAPTMNSITVSPGPINISYRQSSPLRNGSSTYNFIADFSTPTNNSGEVWGVFAGDWHLLACDHPNSTLFPNQTLLLRNVSITPQQPLKFQVTAVNPTVAQSYTMTLRSAYQSQTVDQASVPISINSTWGSMRIFSATAA